MSPSIALIVQELKNPEDEQARILIFIVTADFQAHTYMDGESSSYYVRIGRETRIAKNGILMQLMEIKQQIHRRRKCNMYSTGSSWAYGPEINMDVWHFTKCFC